MKLNKSARKVLAYIISKLDVPDSIKKNFSRIIESKGRNPDGSYKDVTYIREILPQNLYYLGISKTDDVILASLQRDYTSDIVKLKVFKGNLARINQIDNLFDLTLEKTVDLNDGIINIVRDIVPSLDSIKFNNISERNIKFIKEIYEQFKTIENYKELMRILHENNSKKSIDDFFASLISKDIEDNIKTKNYVENFYLPARDDIYFKIHKIDEKNLIGLFIGYSEVSPFKQSMKISTAFKSGNVKEAAEIIEKNGDLRHPVVKVNKDDYTFLGVLKEVSKIYNRPETGQWRLTTTQTENSTFYVQKYRYDFQEGSPYKNIEFNCK